MNRTTKEATVKPYYYDSHAQLTTHLYDFINAYNYGRRLKTLRGLTPYEYICKCWTNEPERFSLNPHHQMPGLNILGKSYLLSKLPPGSVVILDTAIFARLQSDRAKAGTGKGHQEENSANAGSNIRGLVLKQFKDNRL